MTIFVFHQIYNSLNREILRLAIPNILSNLSVPLLSSVDTALMGGISGLHIGAVGIGSMVFNFIYWNFNFLRSGTTGITAQAYGRRDNKGVVQTLANAILVALAITLFVLVLQQPLGWGSMSFMMVSEEHYELVSTYFFTRLWAAPAALLLMAQMGWFFGMQNAIYPLILTIIINVVNIVGNLIFVYGLEMDVDGVAWATVIAQYMGLFSGILLIAFTKKYRLIIQQNARFAFEKLHALRHFLNVNRDVFIRTFLLSLVFSFFYRQSSTEGAAILAVNVILMQFLNWMSFGVDGFAFAAESLVGKYTGAKDRSGTFRAIRLSFIWGMVLALLYSLVYGLFGNLILGQFTDKIQVIQQAQPFLIWMIVLPIAGTPCYIWEGIFIGLTAARALRNSMLGTFILTAIAYYFLAPFGNHGLWLSMMIFLLLRGIIQSILFKRAGPDLT